MEKKVELLEGRLNEGNDRFGEIEKSNKVILRCLQALLAESLGDNSTEAIKKAKEELDNYFLEK